MTTYTPHKWVIISLTQNNTIRKKVLGSWYGGYNGSDSYRLSSDISSIEDCVDHYKIHNHSGSMYVCNKRSNGISIFARTFLSSIIKKYPKIKFKILDNI